MLLLWFIILKAISFTLGLDNGLAMTPPMGWLTWLGFECSTNCEQQPNTCISEDLIKRTADRMVSDGYLEAGYNYIAIDDCWMESKRAPDGRLVPDRKRFKSGMKALADYVHSKGLKFGLYEDWGKYTCQGLPGLWGHEELDVETFVEWGVDYVKVDGCNSDINKMDKGYPEFGKLLNETGRPMLYSCSWPAYQEGVTEVNYTEIAKACNIWRNWGDVSASWGSVLSIMKWFGDNQARLAPHAGPGHWNDPDMLVVGHDALSVGQAQAQMAVWAILAAPLIMSVDLDIIKPKYKDILLNRHVIAVNQDPLGQQGLRIINNDTMDLWIRVLSDERIALAIVAKERKTPREMSFSFSEMNIPEGNYDVKDLFEEDKPRTLNSDSNLSVTFSEIPGVKFYMLIPKKGEENVEKNYLNLDLSNEINV